MVHLGNNRWPIVRLGDICDLYQPQTLARKDLDSNGPFPVYGANGVIGHHSAYNHENPELVMGCRGVCGVLHITEAKSWINGNAMVVHPRTHDLDISYLHLVLTAMQTKIAAITSGAAQPQITRTGLAPLEIPIPSPSVQHQIVARLERELAEADSLAANFKRIAELADAEFKAELNEKFDKLNGKTAILGEVCDIKTGKKDVNQGSPDGQYPFFTCARKPTRADTYSFDCSALLIAGNGDVGFTQKYEGKFEVYQRTYVLYDFKGFLRDYIYYVLQSGFREFAGLNKLGATMPYIKMGTLTNFPVPSIPISQQAILVDELDAESTRFRQLNAVAVKGLHAAESLRAAILSEAFTQ